MDRGSKFDCGSPCRWENSASCCRRRLPRLPSNFTGTLELRSKTRSNRFAMFHTGRRHWDFQKELSEPSTPRCRSTGGSAAVVAEADFQLRECGKCATGAACRVSGGWPHPVRGQRRGRSRRSAGRCGNSRGHCRAGSCGDSCNARAGGPVDSAGRRPDRESVGSTTGWQSRQSVIRDGLRLD